MLKKSGFLPQTPVRNFDAYVVPQFDGTVLVGATREESQFDQIVTAEGIRSMLEAAILSFPSLGGAEFVSGRSGVRPATPDNMPILGPVDSTRGLSIATGHDSVGIMLSPATAELLTQILWIRLSFHVSELVFLDNYFERANGRCFRFPSNKS